ncbi:hypothetical protein Unana1_07917 [Umbelopsis nana]
MASEDVFDRLSRTNKRRKKSSKRAKAPKVTTVQSDSDDYMYPGTYGMDDNEEDDFQDEIEYGSNKLVLPQEGNEDSACEDDDNFTEAWAKPSWLEIDEDKEEEEEDDDEDDIYSLGFISRESRSLRPPMQMASGSISTRSTDIESYSDLGIERNYDQDTRVQQRDSTIEGQRKRQRVSFDDTQWETTASSSDDNIYDMIEKCNRRRRAKSRRIAPQPSRARSGQFDFNIDSGEPSDENTASPSGHASSSTSDLRRQFSESTEDSFGFEASTSGDSNDEFLPAAISRRSSIGLGRGRARRSPQSRRQAIHTQTPIVLSSDQSQSTSRSSTRSPILHDFRHLLPESEDEDSISFMPPSSNQSDSIDTSEYEDGLADDREYALGDAYRNVHYTPPSRQRQVSNGSHTTGFIQRHINFTTRTFEYSLSDSDEDEDEVDDEVLARRLQDQELATFSHTRPVLGSFGSQSAFSSRTSSSPMQLGRQLSGTFATFPGRSRMEAHSSRSSSLFGELDDLPSSREVSEDVLYNPEDPEDEEGDFLQALEVIFAGVMPRDRQRRGPLTERHEFSALYQSLTALGGWSNVATNPLNYMADDELDTSYEGLWRLSEQIGYERQRGLSADARKKLPVVTWRQHSRVKLQNITAADGESSKGKERAHNGPQKLDQR